MVQKSCPRNAPTSAEAANIAVTPGKTVTFISKNSVGPFSITSKTAEAIAKTLGSPDETTTTVFPSKANSSANLALSNSTRLSLECIVRFDRGLILSTYGPYPTISVAEEITLATFGKIISTSPGPRPTTNKLPFLFSL